MKFYFVYKALAHPERDGMLQPISLAERVLHAQEATRRLGSSIPFLVDAMDNRLKHALGDRNNSEFVIDPDGKIIRKRTWSNPELVRQDLETLVGKVGRVTSPDEVGLKTAAPKKDVASRGIVDRISRSGMTAIVAEPQIEKEGRPFFAKLRAEADEPLLNEGRGKLYLGFHLDPLYQVHWNNLRTPLRYELELPEGVRFPARSGQASPLKVETDIDPREFLIDVEKWPPDGKVRLTVTYAACTDDACHEVRQSYVLARQRDRDGGRATTGLRARTPAELLKRLMEGDKNGDGKLARDELHFAVRSRFAEFDSNKSGWLEDGEIRIMADQLTERRKQ